MSFTIELEQDALKRRVDALEERIAKLEKASAPIRLVGRMCRPNVVQSWTMRVVAVETTGVLRLRCEDWAPDFVDFRSLPEDVEWLP